MADEPDMRVRIMTPAGFVWECALDLSETIVVGFTVPTGKAPTIEDAKFGPPDNLVEMLEQHLHEFMAVGMTVQAARIGDIIMSENWMNAQWKFYELAFGPQGYDIEPLTDEEWQAVMLTKCPGCDYWADHKGEHKFAKRGE